MARLRGSGVANDRLMFRWSVHPDEAAETIIQLTIYAGFPAAWQTMDIANKVIAEPPTPSIQSR